MLHVLSFGLGTSRDLPLEYRVPVSQSSLTQHLMLLLRDQRHSGSDAMIMTSSVRKQPHPVQHVHSTWQHTSLLQRTTRVSMTTALDLATYIFVTANHSCLHVNSTRPGNTHRCYSEPLVSPCKQHSTWQQTSLLQRTARVSM